MKKFYETPTVSVATIRNEDVLTATSGTVTYEGFQTENSATKVKNVYDFTTKFGG